MQQHETREPNACIERLSNMKNCWTILTFFSVYTVGLAGAIASVVLISGKSDDWIAGKYYDINSLPIASAFLVVTLINSQIRDFWGERYTLIYIMLLFGYPVAVLVVDILDIVDADPCNSRSLIKRCATSVRFQAKAGLAFTISSIFVSVALTVYSTYRKGKIMMTIDQFTIAQHEMFLKMQFVTLRTIHDDTAREIVARKLDAIKSQLDEGLVVDESMMEEFKMLMKVVLSS